MRRPRPLARLIDGPPGLTGGELLRRSPWLVIPAMTVANALGAMTVFVLVVFVVPLPDLDDQAEIALVNLAALVGYLAFALVCGARFGVGRYR
ncbi:MAG TPA: hypothetical protein VFZ89_18830, partial [Solirubrobacteraceae bacterium]